jgi:hypothetical protein
MSLCEDLFIDTSISKYECETASLTFHLQGSVSTVKSVYRSISFGQLFIDTFISKYEFETSQVAQGHINYVDTLKVLQ